MTPRAATYWEWIRSEAALINTDGCSAVMGFHVECCFEHDLGYYYAADSHEAYRRWRNGEFDYWAKAAPLTKGDVDARFRRCHQNRSAFGRWSPMAIYRWLGVKWGAQPAWDRHRQREQEAGRA